MKKVLGRCRGGFHLSQPEVAIDIIRRTRDIVPEHIPVTVKMRRGIDDSQQSRDHFFAILDGGFAAGIAAVTVHGRTVEQRYVGPSRWEFLRDVKQHVGGDRIVLGSGDLFSAKDCLRMMQTTGIDGVTVARGAIGNPWIFTQARDLADGRPLPPPPTVHQQADVLRQHFELCAESYGEQRAPLLMRKFCIKYTASHSDTDTVRAAFTKMRTREAFDQVLRDHYLEDGPGQYPPAEIHRSQSEC